MDKWKAQRTLLLIGEGSHEVAFLTHVKNLYVSRGCGLNVKIMNARGKGAKHVVNYASRLFQNYKHDACGVLLDTDTDYNHDVLRKAKKHGITLLKSEPCLEAMLLRMLGRNFMRKSGKEQLSGILNGNLAFHHSYTKHFTTVFLEEQRSKEKTVDELLALLTV